VGGLQVWISAPEGGLAHLLAGSEADVEGAAFLRTSELLLQGKGDSGGKAAQAEHWRAVLVERGG
jgi:hypothetical protein